MRNVYAKTTITRAPMWDHDVFTKAVEHISAFYGRNSDGEITCDIPALIEEHCGRYSRGKYDGEIRGWMYVKYVSRGGWRKDGPGYMNGGVVRPGQILGVAIKDYNGNDYISMGEEIATL